MRGKRGRERIYERTSRTNEKELSIRKVLGRRDREAQRRGGGGGGGGGKQEEEGVEVREK